LEFVDGLPTNLGGYLKAESPELGKASLVGEVVGSLSLDGEEAIRVGE
jgi:hypothetical protein